MMTVAVTRGGVCVAGGRSHMLLVKSLQLCPTLCHPMDCSPPGFSVHGMFQARTLKWVAISSPGDLPDSGVEPRSPALQADS